VTNIKSSDNPSNELKIYELSLIWKEAAYNFAFWHERMPQLDWDKAYRDALPMVLATQNLYDYYLELMKFVALLRDGHTDIMMPQSIESNPAYTSKLPVQLIYNNGRYVISNVKRVAGDMVKRWSVVKKIDGQDIHEYVKQRIFPYIWHEKPDSVGWRINDFISKGPRSSGVCVELDDDGMIDTVMLTRTKGDVDWLYNGSFTAPETMKMVYQSDSHQIEMTNDGIAIITINTMTNNDLPTELHANFTLLTKARGYILDIRYNGGGDSRNSDAVAAMFIDGMFQNQRSLHPIHMGVYKAWGQFADFGDKTWDEVKAEYGDDDYIKGVYKIPRQMYYDESISNSQYVRDASGVLAAPLVVLTTANTASASEDLLVALTHAKRAIIVGTPSYGSTGQPLIINLESGGSVRICTRHNTHIDGSEFINMGVQPHVHFEPSLSDLRTGVDAHMGKGLETMRKLITV